MAHLSGAGASPGRPDGEGMAFNRPVVVLTLTVYWVWLGRIFG